MMLGCILTACIHVIVPTRKLQQRGLAFSSERCIYLVCRYDYGRYRGCLDVGFLVRGSFTSVGFRFERSVFLIVYVRVVFPAERQGRSSQSFGPLDSMAGSIPGACIIFPDREAFLSTHNSFLSYSRPNHVFILPSPPPLPSPTPLQFSFHLCAHVVHYILPSSVILLSLPPEPIPIVGREDPNTHLVERRHGLVRAPYLDLVEEGRGAVAAFAGALRCEGKRENALALVEWWWWWCGRR